MRGHNWETLVKRNDTSYFAHWTDNVQGMGKYVGVNSTSFLKGQHDMEKYETDPARLMLRTPVVVSHRVDG